MPDWTGGNLAEDLAQAKDPQQWLTWVQVPLGSVVMEYGHTPRADVLVCRKSFTNPSFTIYEVKISRADFNSDINRGKYRAYFDYCSQFYFAAPSGLIKKDEVPEGCGLTVRGNNGWRVVKSAPRREYQPAIFLLLKLLMRGYEKRMVEWKQYDRIKYLEYKGLKEASYQFGIQLGHDLGRADELIQLAEELKDKVGKVLGHEYKTISEAVWALKSDVGSLLNQKKYAAEAAQLADIVTRLFQGTRFFANGTPGQLRKIADKLEAAFQIEEI
ncbi:hypothetical protein ES707_03635 [subsurface metagenome]